jgi:hypothetical protein
MEVLILIGLFHDGQEIRSRGEKDSVKKDT